MTVLLVIFTFAAFVLVDYILERKHPATDKARVPLEALRWAAPEPVWVAGYQLPETLHYHRGHTWVRPVDEETVVVGMDDFARRLVSPAEDVRLPAVGDWIVQGEPGISVASDGRSADLVNPIEGEVVELNPELQRDPSLATRDPYGRGWIMKVRTGRLASNLRNLLAGSLARRWMEDARAGLDLRLMALSGSVLQDGGEPVEGYAQQLTSEEWRRLVGEFLLT